MILQNNDLTWNFLNSLVIFRKEEGQVGMGHALYQRFINLSGLDLWDILVLTAMSQHSFTLNSEIPYKSWESHNLHPNKFIFLIVLSAFFCNLQTSLLNLFSSASDSWTLPGIFLSFAYKRTVLPHAVALMTSLAVLISTQNELLVGLLH